MYTDFKCRNPRSEKGVQTRFDSDLELKISFHKTHLSIVKRHLVLAAALLSPALAMAGNFATCLLDELPGTQNDNTAGAAYQVCSTKYPEKYNGVEQGSGRGLLGYDSGAECALAKAKDTRSQNAAGMIRVACNRLYNDPKLTYVDQNGIPHQLKEYNGDFTPISRP